MDITSIIKTILIPLVFFGAWIAIQQFVVTRLRWLTKGHKFGVRIANHLGMKRDFFFSLLGGGGCCCVLGSPETILEQILEEGMPEEQASVELAPYLEQGLEFYVRDFGADEEVEKAKPVIAGLVEKWRVRQEKQVQTEIERVTSFCTLPDVKC